MQAELNDVMRLEIEETGLAKEDDLAGRPDLEEPPRELAGPAAQPTRCGRSGRRARGAAPPGQRRSARRWSRCGRRPSWPNGTTT